MSQMENLNHVTTAELVDLLAKQTSLYTKMLYTGAKHIEFERCSERIKEIQKELGLRRERKDPAS